MYDMENFEVLIEKAFLIFNASSYYSKTPFEIYLNFPINVTYMIWFSFESLSGLYLKKELR